MTWNVISAAKGYIAANCWYQFAMACFFRIFFSFKPVEIQEELWQQEGNKKGRMGKSGSKENVTFMEGRHKGARINYQSINQREILESSQFSKWQITVDCERTDPCSFCD